MIGELLALAKKKMWILLMSIHARKQLPVDSGPSLLGGRKLSREPGQGTTSLANYTREGCAGVGDELHRQVGIVRYGRRRFYHAQRRTSVH